MTTPAPAAPLAEQRRRLREQLATQRVALADQMGPVDKPRDTYPRSITMRWLMPALVTTLVRRVAGTRVAAAMPALLALGRRWRVP